jgi:hypothetical protein
MLAAFGQGAQADQIKRRARNVADQNNERQGVPPAAPARPPTAQPAASAKPAATVAPQLSPQQRSVASIHADLSLLAATNSSDARRRFSKTLLASARNTGKPTGATTDQLSEHVAAAVQGVKFSSAQLDRLAQNLDGAMNAAGMAKAQTDAIAEDMQSVLQKAGASLMAASLVANDLRLAVTEVQKPTGK